MSTKKACSLGGGLSIAATTSTTMIHKHEFKNLHTHTSHHITVSCAWETNVHTKLPTEILQVLHKHVVLPSVDLLVLMLLLLLMLVMLLLLRLLLLLLLWLLLLSPLSPGSGAGGPGAGAGAGAGVVFLFLFPLSWSMF